MHRIRVVLTFSLCKPNVLTACKSMPLPPLMPFFFQIFRQVRRMQQAMHVHNARRTMMMRIIVAHGGTKKLSSKQMHSASPNGRPSLDERKRRSTGWATWAINTSGNRIKKFHYQSFSISRESLTERALRWPADDQTVRYLGRSSPWIASLVGYCDLIPSASTRWSNRISCTHTYRRFCVHIALQIFQWLYVMHNVLSIK